MSNYVIGDLEGEKKGVGGWGTENSNKSNLNTVQIFCKFNEKQYAENQEAH